MVKINNVKFIGSFNDIKTLPRTNLPEIAIVGRSNVGKSSLINDLCNQKIAKVSATPGKTVSINFMLINNIFYFVDLPGYGFAKAPKALKKNWQSLIEAYILNREQMKVIFFLLDIRRIPNEHDKMLNNFFKKLNNVKIFYILTKSDKLSANEQKKQKINNALELFVDQSEFIFYSIIKKTGKIEILKKLTGILA
jgi:GTP-binding protein